MPHLIKNSNDFMSKLSCVKLPVNFRFLKLDIKEFYMSGSHPLLSSKSALAVDPSLREDYCLLASAVLNSQHVTHDSGVYRVLSGAGMGLAASGHVADATFYHHAEKDFVLEPSIRTTYGLFFYARFKDDIFLVFETPDDDISVIRKFLVDFKAKCDPFVISMDSISRRCCQMLDLCVSVGADRFPVFSLFTKPTSIWQPLGVESCHHPSIHLHWPINQCRRIRERFSDPDAGIQAVDEFCAAYRAATNVDIQPAQPKPNHGVLASWFIIPFDFVMMSAGIQKAFDSVRVPLGALGSFSRVKVSWSLCGPHLMHLLRKA